jgi:hypothetical protein
LSAFLFSTVSSFAFSDDTSLFLLMLAIVTFALNATSFFVVRLLPPQPTLPLYSPSNPDSQILHRAKSHDGQSQQFFGEPAKPKTPRTCVETFSSQGDHNSSTEEGDTRETSSLLSKSSDSCQEEYGFRGSVPKNDQPGEVDIRGLALLAEPQFWQLFFIFGLLSGVGLMNIK